jgi:hypothetical protein
VALPAVAEVVSVQSVDCGCMDTSFPYGCAVTNAEAAMRIRLTIELERMLMNPVTLRCSWFRMLAASISFITTDARIVQRKLSYGFKRWDTFHWARAKGKPFTRCNGCTLGCILLEKDINRLSCSIHTYIIYEMRRKLQRKILASSVEY